MHKSANDWTCYMGTLKMGGVCLAALEHKDMRDSCKGQARL